MPSVKRLYEDLKGIGLEVVSVTTFYGFFGQEGQKDKDMKPADEFARMPAMLAEQGVKWPMVYVERPGLALYGVSGIPQFLLLDRQGNLQRLDAGASDGKFARMRAKIEELLGAPQLHGGAEPPRWPESATEGTAQ